MMATGLVLASCGGPSADEAATEICECYKEVAVLTEKAGNAESATELIETTEEMKKLVPKVDKCQEKWDEKYNGKVDVEEFKTALKAKNKTVYEILDERGLF